MLFRARNPPNGVNNNATEIFAADQPPLPPGQDLYRRTTLDTWTGLEASNACKDFTDEQNVINTGGDPWAEKWIQTGAGKDWLEAHNIPRNFVIAPQRECTKDDPQPTIEFRSPSDGDTITESKVDVKAVIDAPDGIKTWTLEYGAGNNPDQWVQIADGKDAANNPVTLLNWDVSDVGSDTVTLRLYVTGKTGYAERKITLKLQLPTPTPPPTFTPTETVPAPTDTPTPTPSSTLPAPTDTPTPSVTPFPSATVTPTP